MAKSADKRELKKEKGRERWGGGQYLFAWGRKQHRQMNHKWLKQTTTIPTNTPTNQYESLVNRDQFLDIPATAVCTSPLLGLKDLTVHNCGISDDDYDDDDTNSNNNGCSVEQRATCY